MEKKEAVATALAIDRHRSQNQDSCARKGERAAWVLVWQDLVVLSSVNGKILYNPPPPCFLARADPVKAGFVWIAQSQHPCGVAFGSITGSGKCADGYLGETGWSPTAHQERGQGVRCEGHCLLCPYKGGGSW
jgi:hypothetical protein